MFDEDDKPPPVARPKLEEMSIEALGTYIDDLRAEIARAETAIETKKGVRGVADALFKS